MLNIINTLVSSPTYLAIFILLIGSYFYRKVSGKQPPFSADISKHRELGEQKGFWYQLWIVFITPIMFAYNLILDAIWFVTEIFHFVVRLFAIVFGWLKWIWSELVWPGLSFLFAIAKWYLWTWPWSYIHLSFNSLPKVAYLPYFLAGFTGLALAYGLVHLGAFLDYILSLETPIVTMIFCSLATSLISFGSGLITSMLRNSVTKGNWKTVKEHVPNAMKALRFVLIYALLACILICAEFIVWRAGWFHQWGNLIGGLLSGPAVGFAVLSVLNFIIISFATVFAGSFVLDNNELSKDSFRPFILLSVRNIGSVLFSSPIAFINAMILSIIPLALMFGALKLSSSVADFTANNALGSMNEEQKELAWVDSTDYKSVPDSLFEKYLEDLKEKKALDYSMARKQNWGMQVQKFLSIGAKPYEFDAARPMNTYTPEKESVEESLKNVAKNWKIEDSLSRAEIQALESNKQSLDTEKGTLLNYQERYNRAQSDSLARIAWAADTTIDYSIRVMDANDFTISIKEYDDLIKTQTNKIELNKKGLDRIQKMSALDVEILEHESSQISMSRFMDAIAYLLMGLFVAIIWAFAFGFVLPAFNGVWYAIYMKDKEEATASIYIIELWKSMKSINPNQPLMSLFFWVIGLGLFFFIDVILSFLSF